MSKFDPLGLPYFCVCKKSVPRAGALVYLVVMGGDSCSKGLWFESQYRMQDGHFSHLFVVRIVMFVWRTISSSTGTYILSPCLINKI